MISTKGRYALRVMLDLAQHEENGPVPLKDIAARQEISKKYLEIIVKDLVKGGMLKGVSGKGGGYRLSRRPDDYTVGEILCPRASECLTLPLWREYYQMSRDFFFSKRLSDLLTNI